ncbi:hypothetical protein WMY93_033758, partial [Mugilogobius chulae]
MNPLFGGVVLVVKGQVSGQWWGVQVGRVFAAALAMLFFQVFAKAVQTPNIKHSRGFAAYNELTDQPKSPTDAWALGNSGLFNPFWKALLGLFPVRTRFDTGRFNPLEALKIGGEQLRKLRKVKVDKRAKRLNLVFWSAVLPLREQALCALVLRLDNTVRSL